MQASTPWNDVAFSFAERDRHLGIRPVSQLNTRPVVSPVNASRRPSRDAAHHSGLGRLARPFPWGTSTSYSLPASWRTPLRVIFQAPYLTRTIINASLLAVAVIGLWAGAVYAPTAVITLSKQAGIDAANFPQMASLGTGILSIGTIIGCLLAPVLAERFGRKKALAVYYAGM